MIDEIEAIREQYSALEHVADAAKRQGELLGMIATDTPLPDVLEKLMLFIESQVFEVRCSILILDESGKHLMHGAAPSLPEKYCATINGVAIGEGVGSCGTAAQRKQQVIVTDIQTDPLWVNFKELAAAYDLAACWSTPILSFQGKLLGTFAMYYKTVREPDEVSYGLIGVATHIAGLAIDHHQRESELQRLVEERTAELSEALEYVKRTQEDLIQSEKLASLGSMVAGVSHELNTPIGNALMMSSAVLDSLTELDEMVVSGQMSKSKFLAWQARAHDMVSLMDKSIQRASTLISSFKQVAVDQTSERRRQFDLQVMIEELLEALRSTYKNKPWKLTNKIPSGIRCDTFPGPLGQVVTNLVQNASLHGFDGRQEGEISLMAQVADGTLRLSIADDGVGMPTTVLVRIFDPFFTTKLGKGGSGLGLTICHRIATTILAGELKAHSDEGVGTTFTLQMPLKTPGIA